MLYFLSCESTFLHYPDVYTYLPKCFLFEGFALFVITLDRGDILDGNNMNKMRSWPDSLPTLSSVVCLFYLLCSVSGYSDGAVRRVHRTSRLLQALLRLQPPRRRVLPTLHQVSAIVVSSRLKTVRFSRQLNDLFLVLKNSTSGSFPYL